MRKILAVLALSMFLANPAEASVLSKAKDLGLKAIKSVGLSVALPIRVGGVALGAALSSGMAAGEVELDQRLDQLKAVLAE